VSGEARDDNLIDQGFYRLLRGWPVLHDRPEDQVAGQQVQSSSLIAAASISPRSNRVAKDLLDQGFPLIQELVLHGIVKRRMA